ncbi:MAG: thioredoxin family protein [Patescibacteria group bacterium]
MQHSKTLLIILVVLILTAIAYGLYSSSPENKEVIPTEKTAQITPEVEEVAKGSYEAYASEKIARASEEDVVLFFRASWCPSCRALDADIKAQGVPEGLTILDVNYDKETALKQKYGVTTQHTLVQVDASGEMIKKWSGSPTIAELVTQVQ